MEEEGGGGRGHHPEALFPAGAHMNRCEMAKAREETDGRGSVRRSQGGEDEDGGAGGKEGRGPLLSAFNWLV